MKYKYVDLLNNFISRPVEQRALEEFAARDHASILVVYGRRRVGKTELIEQTFKDRNLLKFEGIQGKSPSAQRENFLRELSRYTEDATITNYKCTNWIMVFEVLAKYIKEGPVTLYLEELQWMANFQEDLVAELKYCWDNYFRYNPQLRLILCGSSPSYFQRKVLRSKALYNRSTVELPLHEFSLRDAASFYKADSSREMFDVYLTVGGIPEYLRVLSGRDSVYRKIAEQSFLPAGFFVHEFERIFVSSYADNPRFKTALRYIGSKKLVSRGEINEVLGISSGATTHNLLDELVQSQIIEAIEPLSLTNQSKIIRYRIKDYFLNFYFKFIFPQLNKIQDRQFQANPCAALPYENYRQWLGLAFERFCRYSQVHIASLLGFSGIQYEAGLLYNRATLAEAPGYQIDLAFKRKDRVLTLCEIKYTESKTSLEVIEEMERKIQRMKVPATYTLQRVLITASGTTTELQKRGYFDKVITLDDFL